MILKIFPILVLYFHVQIDLKRNIIITLRHKAGIQEAAVEEALKTWRNSTKRTPNDFTVPGMRKFTIRAEERTTQPHPPSGGTNFVFAFFTVILV